jgi:ribosomal protein L37AE/L43A
MMKPEDDNLFCAECRNSDLQRVGPLGSGSWVCGRCHKVIYGVDRSRQEVSQLIDEFEKWPLTGRSQIQT